MKKISMIEYCLLKYTSWYVSYRAEFEVLHLQRYKSSSNVSLIESCTIILALTICHFHNTNKFFFKHLQTFIKSEFTISYKKKVQNQTNFPTTIFKNTFFSVRNLQSSIFNNFFSNYLTRSN